MTCEDEFMLYADYNPGRLIRLDKSMALFIGARIDVRFDSSHGHYEIWYLSRENGRAVVHASSIPTSEVVRQCIVSTVWKGCTCRMP